MTLKNPMSITPNLPEQKRQGHVSTWVNIFVERLWRSLKYECVYLNARETGSEAKAGVRKWMDFYNYKRPHSAPLGTLRSNALPAMHGGKPPAVIYWERNEATQPDQQEQRVA